MEKDRLKYQIVAIGGSAGSLDVILKIIADLPDDTHASFIIVVHRKNSYDSILEDLVSARTKMKVKQVEDKQPIVPDTVYIAPGDYHLLIEDRNTFSLDSSEKVQYSRPSIDVTFESIAEVFNDAVIGILLSGANADGSEGLKKIRQAGGFTIIQNPESADVSFMPQQAINRKAGKEILHADEIPGCIIQLLKGTEPLHRGSSAS